MNSMEMENPITIFKYECPYGSVYKPSNRFSIASRKTKIEKRFVFRFFIFQFKNKNE